MEFFHYQKRARQRGIREPLIELIFYYGNSSSRPGGAEATSLGGKGIDHVTKDIKKILTEVPKLKNAEVITKNGKILTVQHRKTKRRFKS